MGVGNINKYFEELGMEKAQKWTYWLYLSFFLGLQYNLPFFAAHYTALNVGNQRHISLMMSYADPLKGCDAKAIVIMVKNSSAN